MCKGARAIQVVGTSRVPTVKRERRQPRESTDNEQSNGPPRTLLVEKQVDEAEYCSGNEPGKGRIRDLDLDLQTATITIRKLIVRKLTQY